MEKLIYFAHGKDSEPWGIKIQRLAEIGRSHGFDVESPDYRGLSAEARIEKLLELNPTADRTLILAGSSMGGYVSIAASPVLKPQGLFLLAPAVYLPGYSENKLTPLAGAIEAVHGWGDEIVPPNNVIRFAQQCGSTLHLMDSDHSLVNQLPVIEDIFAAFLKRVSDNHSK